MKKQDEKILTRREQREALERQRESFASSRNFTRNRTISGFEKDKTERVENRKLVIRRRKISMFFIALLGVSVVIFSIILQLIIKFDIVDTNNVKISKNIEYSKSIDKYFEKQPMTRLISYLNKEKLTEDLCSEFPEIKNIVSVDLKAIGSYSFKLEFRKPVASWKSGSKTMFVDSDGVSFETNYFDNPKLEITDESSVRIESGSNVLSSSFISFIGKIVSISAQKGLTVNKVVIPAASLREIQIFVDDIKYPIKLLTTSSPEGQIDNLISAIGFFQKHKLNPSYLDLRVEGRGFYK